MMLRLRNAHYLLAHGGGTATYLHSGRDAATLHGRAGAASA
jgi:hypothetical protein